MPLALTMGDPCGVGPEIIATWLAESRIAERAAVTIFGDPVILEEAARLCKVPAVAHWPVEIVAVTQAAHWRDWDDATCGQHSRHYVERAVEFCLSEGAALVTAPINKWRWQQASGQAHGHTEFLQHLTHSPTVGMMMAGPRLRTVPITIHAPLAAVPGLLSVEKIITQTELTIHFLQNHLKSAKPRIAVTGLNPHAGEGGTLGTEEASIIYPAIQQLRGKGFDVSGPFPADGLFAQAAHGYDAIICMYHDQALIPAKMLDFRNTVNVTMGLPFVRTSPDHGTAEDIAWKNRADAQHLRAAAEMALSLSRSS